MWLVGIECNSYDTSGRQERLSQCDASTLTSVRAAVINGLTQLQKKSDLVERKIEGKDAFIASPFFIIWAVIYIHYVTLFLFPLSAE